MLDAAFEEVYRRHYAFVWRSARRLGVPEAELDDIVQEVFVVGDGNPASTVDLLLVRTAALRGLGRDRDAQVTAERARREAERLGLADAAARARELLR